MVFDIKKIIDGKDVSSAALASVGKNVGLFQKFCGEKNVWLGRAVVLLVVPVRILGALLTPVVSVAESVIRAVGNVFGKLTCGLIIKDCSLERAFSHIKHGFVWGTVGVVVTCVKASKAAFILLILGLYDPTCISL